MGIRWLLAFGVALALLGNRSAARGQAMKTSPPPAMPQTVPPPTPPAGTQTTNASPNSTPLGPADGDDEEKPGPGGRFKVLTGPDALDKLDKINKDKTLKPPIEFFRTQFAPFDILPYAKARHWTTVILELKSNYAGYEGRLQTAPVKLLDMPHEVVYRREARLLKGQQARLGWQVMLPVINRELNLELERPDAIRADDALPSSMKALETHQMLVLILAKNPNDYGHWTRFHALLPTSGERDPQSMEKQRYYRLVIPQDADKPVLSPHPLTWTTISHVIWDGLDPESITPAQQQAMLDWLHWGGQLILVGGAAPSFAPLQDSFLGPYLPADPAGENALLSGDDLAPLANAFRPPQWPEEQDDQDSVPFGTRVVVHRYKEPASIHPATNRPVYFAGLRPRDGVGSVVLPLGESGDRLLGVERRVGRGRILMLSFTPTDPALSSWPGVDTLVQRLILRRPEEVQQSPSPDPSGGAAQFAGQLGPNGRLGPNGQYASRASAWQYAALAGPDLSWLRYVSRDLGAVPGPGPRAKEQGDAEMPLNPVAEWSDRALLPAAAIKSLKEASGITIPSKIFILKVILAYILALVPLNWLICRFVLRRREWAWVLVPLLSFGFAIGVERAAAYDMGFDSGCDEIDVLETYESFPRAHLSRFAALFSTGRVRYTISYPNDPTALSLPMNAGVSLRGEESAQSVWQSLPIPALVGLQVQPRSLQLFRSEQMLQLPGSIDLVTENGPRRIVNGSTLELRDAVLVEDGGDRRTQLGTIKPGETIDLSTLGRDGGAETKAPDAKSWLDLSQFLGPLMSYDWSRPEDRGEIRLVAWAPSLLPGQKIEPAIDRHRGMTLVCAHLAMGPPPSFESAYYDALIPREAVKPPRRANADQPTEAQSAPTGVVAPRGLSRTQNSSRSMNNRSGPNPISSTDATTPSGPETERP
jgi:hypothetical protein